MKTGEFIISLAKQGSVELDEAQTKAIQEMATDLPDEVVTQIQGSLFTKESALANPDIINKLKAESLDAVDQKMKEFAKGFGLDEGFLHNLGETKGTYNRIDAVGKAILASQKQALEKAKEGAPKGDQKELQTEINKLNGEIATFRETSISKTDHDDTVSGFEDIIKEHSNSMLQLQANGLFNGVNWAHKEISPEINTMTALTLFNQELANKNISLVKAENGSLKLQTSEGSDYFVDNKPVTPQDFAKSIVSGHKLDTVTETKIPTPSTQIITGNGEGAPGVAAAMLKAKESIAAIADLQSSKV